MDLNYSCVCVRTCACSTQQEIWDMSSLGACPGLLFAGKPGQSWRGPSSTAPAPPSPWNSDACWQGHLQALSGRWPVAAADTHCGPLHISAFDRGPSRKAEGSVTMEEAACLPREWEGPVHIVREAWLGAVGRGLRWEVGPRASWVTCGKPSPSLVLSMPFWTAGVELGRFSDFKASPESLLPTSLCDLE